MGYYQLGQLFGDNIFEDSLGELEKILAAQAELDLVGLNQMAHKLKNLFIKI